MGQKLHGLALATALTLLLVQLAACGQKGEDTGTPPPPGVVGQEITFSQVALTVNSVTYQDQIGDFFKAGPGQTYATVNVKIQNKRPYQIPYKPYHFTITDSTGAVYQAGVTAGTQPLQSSTLDATKDTTGNINFEVPANAKGLILTYKVPGTTGSITVPLGDVTRS